MVFKDPGGWLGPEAAAGPSNPIAKVMVKVGLYPAGGHLVKRVIGIEGDTIECCDEQGRIKVNGTALNEEKYVADNQNVTCNGPMQGCSWKTGPIPKGHIFVMGDNRPLGRLDGAHVRQGPDRLRPGSGSSPPTWSSARCSSCCGPSTGSPGSTVLTRSRTCPLRK